MQEVSLPPKHVQWKPYQPEMLAHLHANPKALLFAEMGLGKTVVVLKYIDDLLTGGESRGVLFCSPLRVKQITIPEQCRTWIHSSWMKVVDMSTPEGEKAWNEGGADLYLTHYDVLASREVTRKCPKCKGKKCSECDGGYVTNKYPGFAEKFMKGRKQLPVDTVVYDEISKFKAHDGTRAKAIRAYHHHFSRIVGLTGSPLGNSRLNLFNQVRMVDGGERLGPSFHAFRQRYAESDYMGYKWEMRPGAAEKIDEKIADIALVLLNKDHANLPPCYFEDIEVTLPASAVAHYKKIEKELLLELEKGDIVALNAAVLAGKMLQITGGACYGDDKEVHHLHTAKVDALKKLRTKLGPKEPLIVLASFKHETARLLEALPGSKVFHKDDMAAWQSGKIHTIIADARSIGFGVDGLQTTCANMVFFTPYWSAEVVQQVIKRIHRLGNPRDTYIWRLIATIPGKVTIDEVVIESNRLHTEEQETMLASLKTLQRLNQK